jgi:hypothetical protein
MKETNLQLIKGGKITTKDGREYTRLMGGFGEGKPSLTVRQISELMEKELKHVNETINNNINHFEKNIHLIDLKNSVDIIDPVLETLKSLGYSKQSISNSKNIYILSESGFLLYLKFAEGDKSVDLYKDFIEDYFQTKAENEKLKVAVSEELDSLVNERITILGKMFYEQDEKIKMDLFNRCESLNDRISKLNLALKTESLENAILNQARLKESKAEYVNQSDFGERFNRKLGAKTVGKLFQIVGLAKKTYNRTTPYERYVPKYAVNVVDNEIAKNYDVAYVWNYNLVVEFIDKWLKNNGKYDIFYSIVKKGEMIQYVNTLYEETFSKAV